jgi:hypothetical protein
VPIPTPPVADSSPTGEVPPTVTTGPNNVSLTVLQTAAVAPRHGSAYGETPAEKAATQPQVQRRYRWHKGDCLANYAHSANVWTAVTSTEEFALAFRAIIEDTSISNDDRSARAEQFLLDQATAAGVVEVTTTHREFTNPNKWDKHLAPWFSA